MSELDKTIPQLNLYPESSPISGAELIYMTKNGEDWALNLSRLYASATPSAHGLISSTHTITGKTTGHFLRAKAGDTYDFEALLKTDVLPLLSDWFTLEGTAPNQYIRCNYSFASAYEVSANASSGYVPPSLWDSLPTATANVKGGVKVGSGLSMNGETLYVSGNFASTWGTITGTLTNQTDLVNALGLKADLVNGLIPSAQLPSFVDDVLEYASYANLPATGESGKIYITQDTNITYRWTGSAYAEISASLALGETSATAYRGDRGKTAYDHSQASHQAILNGTGFVKVSGTTISYDNSTYSLSSHVHGNILNNGYLGSTANIPLITGTGGIIQAGSFGSAANTFCQGNDARLTDARTPVSHAFISANHTITGKTTGHFLRAKAGDAYDFEALLKTDVLPLLSDWFTLEGTAPNQYIRCNYSFASAYEVSANASSGYVPPSLWDSLPTATASVKGGVKVGSGLAMNGETLYVSGNFASTWGTITGTLANQSDLVSALGLKADLVNGLIPSNQLPSYVDDVLEYSSSAYFPAIGESGKIYIAQDTNLTYRWSGTAYAEISASLALGETSATAYRGDRGKTAYDHSQASHAYLSLGGGTMFNTNLVVSLNANLLDGYYHSDFMKKMGYYSTDLNNDIVDGTYYYVPTTANKPVNSDYGNLLTITGGIGWYNQIAFGTDKATLKWRSSINNNTTFDAWKDIYNSANSNLATVDWTANNVFVGYNGLLGFQYASGDLSCYNYIEGKGALPLKLRGGAWTGTVTQEAIRLESNNGNISLLNNGKTGFGTVNPQTKIEAQVSHATNVDEEIRLGSYYGGVFYGLAMNYKINSVGSPSKHIVDYNGNTRYTAITIEAGDIGIGMNPLTGSKLQVAGVTDFWNATNTLLRVQHNGTLSTLQSYTGGLVGNMSLNSSGGNVAIGHNSPQKALHILANSDNQFRLDAVLGQRYTTIDLANNNNVKSQIWWDNTNGNLNIQSSGGTQPLNLQPNGGKVGVNNDAPAQTLDIWGTLRVGPDATYGLTIVRNGSTGYYDYTNSQSGYGHHFNDNVIVNGEVSANYSSDIRLKTNVKDFSGLSIIQNLNPKSYQWNTKAKELNSTKDTEINNFGLIAQDLQSILPELVKPIFNKEYLAIDYIQLIPVLIQALKEQQVQINELKNN